MRRPCCEPESDFPKAKGRSNWRSWRRGRHRRQPAAEKNQIRRSAAACCLLEDRSLSVSVGDPRDQGRVQYMNTTRKNDIVVFLATGFFTGFLPMMPGTWGTFAGIPLVIITLRLTWMIQAVVAAVFVVVAVSIAERAEVLFEDRDARPIVIDEMAGFLVTLLWLPLNLLVFSLGFLLFRVFDIVKPPPIAMVENRLQGGWGIVMDDVLAGVFANATLRLLLIVAGLL